MTEMLIGCLIGAVITWLVSYWYYKKAGDSLAKEAKTLKQQTQLILTALEQAGLVEVRRENGVITGFEKWNVRPKAFDSSVFGSNSIGYAPKE